MVTSVGSSIVTALGGSSIDTSSLVDQLATASIADKKAALTAKETANTTKISDLATVLSTMSTFSSSLSTLISGGTLYTQPTSSNTSIIQVSALAGARLSGLSSTIKVGQLATGQTLSSIPLSNNATAIGQGTLTLTVGSQTKTITIDSTNDSMAGLALAIKSAGLGVSASTVTDNSGTRLVVKGSTGTDNAFSLTLASGDPATLGRFTFDPTTYDPNATTQSGFTRTQAAQNATLTVDGVAITKASNSFSDVIDGVKIDLQSAAPDTTITIGANQPIDAITQGISDFVSAYNEMKATLTKLTDPTTGSLKSDSGVRQLVQQMAQLPSTQLTYATDGSPTTLAEIGVSTNRDGTLTLDTARLSTIMQSTPDAVEAMFNPSQRSDNALLKITSPVGKTAGGIYTITNASAATSTSAAHAMINGAAALPSNDGVIASFFSPANGLAFTPLGDVASATITIDTGLAGALSAIQTALTSSSGVLTASQNALTDEKTSLAADEDALTARDTTYRAQLTTQFTAMQQALLSYNSTQSFLTQQIKVWTNSSSG